MKGQIPGGRPGIFPLVWHGNDIKVVQVFPIAIAPIFTIRGRRWHPWIAIEPLL